MDPPSSTRDNKGSVCLIIFGSSCILTIPGVQGGGPPKIFQDLPPGKGILNYGGYHCIRGRDEAGNYHVENRHLSRDGT